MTGHPAAPVESDEVQALLADLSKVRDFPALSQVVSQVGRVAGSENAHTDELTKVILRDVSLTNKLLRVVNSAQFGHLGGQPINTISRAIVILGFDTIRDIALSLMLFEHLNNHALASELKGEAVEGFFAGILGRGLAARAGVRDKEEVFICTLFRNMGRMMARLHFHDKTRIAEQLMRERGIGEEQASRRALGISYDEFGQALGRHWHLPHALLLGMQPLPAGPLKAPANDGEKLRMLSNMANELYQATRDAAPEKIQQAIVEVGKRYADAVRIPVEHLAELVYEAGQAMDKEARILQVDVHSSPLVHRLLQGAGGHAAASDARAAEAGDDAQVAEIGEDAAGILITGLQDLTSMLLDDSRLSDLMQVAAELLYRARCFDNVVICAIAPGGQELRGRIALGAHAEALKRHLRVPLNFTPDAFHAAVSKGADLLIEDSGADNIRERIPAWYHQHIDAKSFLLLPIHIGGKAVGLIYGDRRERSLRVPPQTLGLIKALRNQITLAVRQKNSH
jgi:HD-like signal output (HDOD) protein